MQLPVSNHDKCQGAQSIILNLSPSKEGKRLIRGPKTLPSASSRPPGVPGSLPRSCNIPKRSLVAGELLTTWASRSRILRGIKKLSRSRKVCNINQRNRRRIFHEGAEGKRSGSYSPLSPRATAVLLCACPFSLCLCYEPSLHCDFKYLPSVFPVKWRLSQARIMVHSKGSKYLKYLVFSFPYKV